MKSDDSATLVIVLAPNRLALIWFENLWNIETPPSRLLISSGTMQRSGASPG
jgi:hypothetical protein